MDVRFPNGTVISNVPEGTTKADLLAKLKRNGYDTDALLRAEAPIEETTPPDRGGFLKGIKRGTEAMISSGRTALGTVTGSPEEAALAGLARQEEQAKKYGEGLTLDEIKKIYGEEGVLAAVKKVGSEVPGAIGEQVPNIVSMGALARIGSKLGTKLPGPYGKAIGAVVGAALPSLIQQYSGGVESQAAAQKERGEPISIDRGRALGFALPEAALDVAAQAIPLGRSMAGKLFGREIEALLSRGEGAAAEKLARESLTSTLVKGTAVGAFAEVPTEVAQTALDRLNAGRSLTDADALKDYGDTALQVSLLAPIGALGRLSERSAARTRVAEETARQEAEARAQAAQTAAPPTPPETEVAPTQAATTPEEPPEQQVARRAQAESAFQKMVMAGLQNKPTVAEFQSLTGLSRSAARAEMDRMVDSGFLQKDEKSGRYSIVPEYSQFQFVEPGEKPRAALNAYPTEEDKQFLSWDVPPPVSRRQMDLFGGAPAGPTFYGNQEGVVGTSPEAVQQQAQQDAFIRAHAENLQKQAEAKAVADFNAQRDKAQADRANVLEALKQDTSIKTIQDTLKVPYNDARKYMMGLRDDGIVEYKNNAWRLTTESTETTTPTAPKAPAAGKEPIFDQETYQKALDAVTANGKATVSLIQKATGSKYAQAVAFMKDLRDKGVTNGKNEIVTTGTQPNGAPAESGKGRRRKGTGVSVQQGAPGVGESTESVGRGLAGPDDVTGGVAGGEEEGEAPLTEKPRRPLHRETEKVLRKVVAADEMGAMTPDLLDQIKSELNAVTPDYPLIHSLIDAATKPVKATLDTKTGEGMDLDLVRHEARRRIIRNIYRRAEKAAEAEKAPAPKAKVAPTKEKAPAAPVETKSVDALRSEYSSRAIDALGDEKISEETYDSIRDALKASNPDFKSIDKMLEGRGRRRAATEESAARGRAAAKEGKVKRGSSAKDLEAAADALLREGGYDAEGELRFQRRRAGTVLKDATPDWYYSRLSRTVDALPEKAFASPEALLNKLRTTPGIKKDELEASGLAEIFNLSKTKEELAGYSPAELKKFTQDILATHGFKLTEVVHGQEQESSALKRFKKQLQKLEVARNNLIREFRSVIAPVSEHIDKVFRENPEVAKYFQENNDYSGSSLMDPRSPSHIRNNLIDGMLTAYIINPAQHNDRLVKNALRNHFYGSIRIQSILQTIAPDIYNGIDGQTIRSAAALRDKLDQIDDQKYTILQDIENVPTETAPWSTYVQPGDYSNYRVFLLQNPGSKFLYTHYQEPGVLAHIRTTDRIGPNGEKILFIEEIQSDWEQRLRDEKLVESFKAEFDSIPESERIELTENYRDYLDLLKRGPEYAKAAEDIIEKDDAKEYMARAKKVYRYQLARGNLAQTRNLTEGPFVTDGKAISKLALKRVLSQAAYEGYDRIEFVRGEESAKSVGGELGGQKHYYNQLLPSELRKLAHEEKLNTKITPPGPEEGRLSIEMSPDVREQILKNKFSLFQLGAEGKNTVPHEDVVRAVKEATAGWRNAPKIEVVRNADELPERYQTIPDNTRGFYVPSTKTLYVISENAPSISGAKATVFHESLGHYGLDKKFRGDLDTVLGKMYDENAAMKNAADEWLKDNPSTYAHLPESKQLARAVEEVLAERSEAGPIKEGGLRGLYNRLVAFIRDWARRHGLGGKYSDNDITQILRQAHEEVIASPIEQERVAFSLDPQLRYQLTPDEQRRQDETLIRSYATAESKKPIATKEVLARGRETLSKLTPAVRRGLFSSMNQNQLANTYEHAIPSLRTRHDLLNEKGAYLRKQMDHIAELVTHANEVLKKYSYAERQRIHDIFNKTTLDQIEVLDDAKREWVADKANPLYKQFMALDPEVRDIYRRMRETYDNQSNVALGVLYSIAEPSQREKFEKQLKVQRLKVYLPLFRTGDHWLSYTAENGELVKRSFETTNERDQAYREAQRAGVKDLARYHNIEQLVRNAPPSGFFGQVMTALQKSKADKDTINSIVNAYLNLMPAKSVLQMARKREGTAGFMRDTVQAFANVAERNAMHITNLKYNRQIDAVMEKIREEAGIAELKYEADPEDPEGIHPDVKSDLMNAIETSHMHMINPQNNPAMAAMQYVNYMTYLGGNVSTAFITLMHLPTVAYPTLSRISGFNAARIAMSNANKHAINYSYSKGKGVPADLMRVLEQAKADGVLGERRAQDIAEFKQYGTDKYLGIKARVDKVMNSTLGAADKHNREVTMLASYELNRAKLSKEGLTGDALHEAAYKAAKQDVYDTLGSVFSAARANILRQPLGQLFFTFKQDAMHRAYLLARAFRDSVKGESAEVRTAARRQLLGFYAMAGLLAGVSGMPLVGWAEMLAQLLIGAGGDDDTYDVSEEIQNSMGLLPYKGLINYALNINASDRIGWDGMFWRDDPQRRSQIGFMNFAAEKMFGPMATYIGQDMPRAWDHIQNGRLERAAETVMPRVAANVLKGLRYGLNGATTKDGVPIKQDVNAYNAFMQVLGFSPADLAEIQKENSARIGLEKKMYTTKDALIAQFVAAKVNGDVDGQKEVIEKIREFGRKYPGIAISSGDLSGALTKHYKRLAQSVNGMYINPKIQSQLLKAYPSQKATWMGDDEDEGMEEDEEEEE